MTKRAVHTTRSLNAEQAEQAEQAEHAEPAGHAPRPVRSVPGQGAWRRAAAVAAVAATVPYLTLKAAWLAGSRIGIPDGSVLLDPEPFLIAANAVTVAMDACVILLVLVLTRPWGLRVPAWPLTVPVFAATGLLTPIFLGFPGQLLVSLLGFEEAPAAKVLREPFLDSWVFIVVYTGFMTQGLALAALFVPYARERWGRPWQGALGKRLPPSTGVVAAAAAAAGLVVAALYAYWAFGGTAALTADRAAGHSAQTAVVYAAHGSCALAAGAGALLLSRGGKLRARWPLGLAWIGSSATLSWGAWMLITSFGTELDRGEQPGGAIQMIYAGQMIAGSLAAAVLVRFLISRRER